MNFSVSHFNYIIFKYEANQKSYFVINTFLGDKELMQLLFFDAKITHKLYNKTWNPTSESE